MPDRRYATASQVPPPPARKHSSPVYLATVGLPSGELFSTQLDLGAPDRNARRLSLQAAFGADGAALPEGTERWEILGEPQYATVALDSQTGRIYSFAEGEEFYVPMHQDVSSLAYARPVRSSVSTSPTSPYGFWWRTRSPSSTGTWRNAAAAAGGSIAGSRSRARSGRQPRGTATYASLGVVVGV
ncbi:SUKH-4 family immunity protein [Streptomyces exfoliatus]|uniref:SUKH-4 family immunity protein n=1 Tax=Streptomyces exfoliatus TaxID=1905 RepID=UPI0004C8DA30